MTNIVFWSFVYLRASVDIHFFIPQKNLSLRAVDWIFGKTVYNYGAFPYSNFLVTKKHPHALVGVWCL